MSIPPILAYPSDEDIGYAVWLKNFATQLPAYAARHDFSLLQVLQVQCAAGEFVDLIIHRMHCATTGIMLRQLTVLPAEYHNLMAKATHLSDYDQMLRGLVAEAVTRIRLHPAYTDQDGLDLTAKPRLRDNSPRSDPPA